MYCLTMRRISKRLSLSTISLLYRTVDWNFRHPDFREITMRRTRALARVRLILFSFAKGILWATSGYLKDGSRDFVQEAGGARRRRGPRLVSASSNRSWQLSVADAVQEVPRRHLQTELMNPVIGGLEAPISRRTRGY